MSDAEILEKIFRDTPVRNRDYWLEHCSDEESVPMTMLLLAALVPKPRVNLTRFHGVFEQRRRNMTGRRCPECISR